jgi:hypothetical protein
MCFLGDRNILVSSTFHFFASACARNSRHAYIGCSERRLIWHSFYRRNSGPRWLPPTPLQLPSKVKVKVTTNSQSASLSWCQAPIWDLTPDFYFFKTVRVCWCGAPSLTRGRDFYKVQRTICLHFMCYYMNVYRIYTRTRPLSVEAQYSRSSAQLSSGAELIDSLCNLGTDHIENTSPTVLLLHHIDIIRTA